MAALTRYVNTASSAGGDGTTNGTAGATRAYATLLEAVNALPATLTDQYTIYCQGSAADTSSVAQGPWDMVTTATNYIRLIGEQSPNHPNFSTSKSGKYDTSLYRIEVTNSDALYNNIPAHLRIEGIQCKVTVNDAGSYICLKTSNANQTVTDIDCRLAYCIATAVLTSGSVTGFVTRIPDTAGRGTSTVINCLAHDVTQGFENDFGQAGQLGEFYNNTAADCTYGFVNDGNMKVVNNLAANCSIGFVNGATWGTGSDYNAESDGNGGPGAHHRTSQTFTFVNAASNDFHITSGDAGAKGFGLADPGSGLFSDDIDGGTRSGSWDIGMDQQGVVKASGPGAGSDLSLVGVSEASTNLIRVNIVEETS
jgi:hypothetical protein